MEIRNAKTLVELALGAAILFASAGCAQHGYEYNFKRSCITIETKEEIKGTELIEVYKDGRLIRTQKREIDERKDAPQNHAPQKQSTPKSYYNPPSHYRA